MNHLSPSENDLRNQSAAAIIGGQFDPNEVLLPYQKRWIADDSPLKIAEKSRRTGITWAEAADDALTGSMSAAAGGCDTFYVGTTKDMAREFIDACAMWAKMYLITHDPQPASRADMASEGLPRLHAPIQPTCS